MQRIDRGLELVYQRLGWRLVFAYQAFAYTGISTLGAALIALFVRIDRLSLDETVGVVAAGLGSALAAGVVSTWGVIRGSRPLIAWLKDGRERSGAEAAWRAALRLPRVTVAWNTGAMLAAMPLATGAATAIVPLDVKGAVFFAIGYLCAVGTVMMGGLYTAQLASRPIVADVARSLEHRPSWPAGVPVGLKLRVATVPMVVASVGWGLAVGLQPGSGLGNGLWPLLVAIAGALVFAVPVLVLLAYSTLQPLDDLLRATERLKEGDFKTRVPELSADEYGVLARSFNEAMQGLAERERLAGENRDLLEEVRASRARIVSASDAERRRVERNIHDGAQQQLVALAVKLRMLEERTADDEDLRAAIAQIGERLKSALDDLRELARGLHPSVLTTDGLAPALEQLASRASIPVDIDAPEERYDEAVESTAYFVVSEALANVAKYAHASHAQVSVDAATAGSLSRSPMTASAARKHTPDPV
jgi:signal transduction histidine kinase